MLLGHSKSIRCFIALTLLLALWPSHGAAQDTVNPTRATFTASADHNVTDDGAPRVLSYEIGLYILGASQPFQSVSIGKPNPDGTGTITVDLTAAFLGWPVVGTSYTADAAAVGPGGTARSTLSNTFSFTGGSACTFSLTSTSVNPTAGGGSYTTNVTTTSGCAWTAVSNASWIQLTSGGTGTGNGTAAYTVAVNTSISPRTGTLTVAGRPVTVTQGGAPCSFTLSSTAQPAPAAGGSLTTAVTTTTGCTWTTTSNASWITVTSGSATTSGTARYTVAANPTATVRAGTLTIAGQIVTITQAGVSLPPGTPNGLQVTF